MTQSDDITTEILNKLTYAFVSIAELFYFTICEEMDVANW